MLFQVVREGFLEKLTFQWRFRVKESCEELEEENFRRKT